MIFALVRVSRSKTHEKKDHYELMLMETGGSAKWTRVFENEEEVIEVTNQILAKQKRRTSLQLVPDQVRSRSQYFFDLDLTREEAEYLGWKEAAGQSKA